MDRDIKKFINEFTKNFSELYVESFCLRFLSDFDKNKLLESIRKTNELLNKRINKYLKIKLKKMGYEEKYIKNILK